MRNYPILGKYATLLMHNHIFNAFEATIAYIQVKPNISRDIKKLNLYFKNHNFKEKFSILFCKKVRI